MIAVDQKPKSKRRLQRLVNIEANPAVSFLVDAYHEDWSRLWWVRADGTATIQESGAAFDGGISALVDRYPQYQEERPDGPLIRIRVDRVTGWRSTP